MAKALGQPPGRVTVDQFLAWLDEGPEGVRYELVAGQPVEMTPEPAAHARLKAQIWLALCNGIDSAGLPCEALPDGMTVKIDEHTAYEPDAVVQCDGTLPDDAVIVPAPVIVVEVVSPTTRARDTGAKLADYFRLPSVRHYLLVQTERSTMIHHRHATARSSRPESSRPARWLSTRHASPSISTASTASPRTKARLDGLHCLAYAKRYLGRPHAEDEEPVEQMR